MKHLAPAGLRGRREALGLSREKLARIVDPPCSSATIAQVEAGLHCSPEMADRLADAVGCDPADLWPSR